MRIYDLGCVNEAFETVRFYEWNESKLEWELFDRATLNVSFHSIISALKIEERTIHHIEFEPYTMNIFMN